MKTSRLGVVGALLATFMACEAFPAVAAFVQYEMRASDTLPSGPLYGTLTLTQVGDTVQFVAAIGSYWSTPMDIGIRTVTFNFTDDPVLQPGQISTPNYIYSGNVDFNGFGAFTFQVVEPLIPPVTPVPTVQFSISRPGLKLADFYFANAQGWAAAMQIVGYGPPGPGGRPIVSSGAFAAAIPEPSAWILAAAGLLTLGTIANQASDAGTSRRLPQRDSASPHQVRTIPPQANCSFNRPGARAVRSPKRRRKPQTANGSCFFFLANPPITPRPASTSGRAAGTGTGE